MAVWKITALCSRFTKSDFLLQPFVPSESGTVPEFSILKDLISQLGLPLVVIGASAPLLQFAYSQTRYKYANDPYFYM
ncbi:hypothetical protein [Legionella tunisiensis]|uniref:hypothetical protein n=1 Tax=Legionella tunisiensis TaxID=1034944 RepID=UPI0002D3D339|nr:hypothetical protein [Legionella tunisiensis]